MPWIVRLTWLSSCARACVRPQLQRAPPEALYLRGEELQKGLEVLALPIGRHGHRGAPAGRHLGRLVVALDLCAQ